MYQALWVTQSLVDQRTADREAEAAAYRLARNLPLRRPGRLAAFFSRQPAYAPDVPAARSTAVELDTATVATAGATELVSTSAVTRP